MIDGSHEIATHWWICNTEYKQTKVKMEIIFYVTGLHHGPAHKECKKIRDRDLKRPRWFTLHVRSSVILKDLELLQLFCPFSQNISSCCLSKNHSWTFVPKTTFLINPKTTGTVFFF